VLVEGLIFGERQLGGEHQLCLNVRRSLYNLLRISKVVERNDTPRTIDVRLGN
jgi:hypothetical protein